MADQLPPRLLKDLSLQEIDDAREIIGALAPQTQRAYLGHLRRYIDAGYDLTGKDLRAWIESERKKGRAPGSIRASIIALRKMAATFNRPIEGKERELIWAALRRACRENRDQARGSVEGVGWKAADKVARLASRSGDPKGLRDAAIIRIASDAMLRVSEISALDIDDFQENEDGTGFLIIRASKTDQSGKGAIQFIGKETVKALRAWIREAEITSGPLFISVRGPKATSRITCSGILKMIKARLEAMGIKGRVGGHSFRRGSAASLIQAGAHIVEVQEAGRWASVEMVKRYAAGQLGNPIQKYRYSA